ncbi:MAG TPA: hypothetical protein DD384_04905 [Firmicutes bacterium]|nr:hypothetical protein [Bacillota bacterium]
MKNKVYTPNHIVRALGATLAISSLIFFLSAFTKTTWGIAFLFEYLFGMLGYWILLPVFLFYGLWILFRGIEGKKKITWRMILGFFLLFIGVSLISGYVSASFYAKNNLNLYDLYGTEKTGLKGEFALGKGIFDAKDGGGILFTGFASLINLVGDALTITVSIVVILGGLVLIFLPFILRFAHFVSSKCGAYKAKKESEASLREAEEESRRALERYVEENQPIEMNETVSPSPLSYEVKPEDPLPGSIPSRTNLYHSKTVSEVSPVPQETTPVEPAKENVFVQETFENKMQEAVFNPKEEMKRTASSPKKIEAHKESVLEEKMLRQEEIKPDFGEIVLPDEKTNRSSDMNVVEKTGEAKKPSIPSVSKIDETPYKEETLPQEETASISNSNAPSYQEIEEETPAVPTSKRKTAPIAAETSKENVVSAKEIPSYSQEEEEIPTQTVDVEPLPVEEKKEDASVLLQKKEISQEEKLGIKPAKERPPYEFPPEDLLKTYQVDPSIVEQNKLLCQQRTDIINQTFESFDVGAKVVSYTIGPSVTRYDIEVDRGTSVSSVGRYIKDISAHLGGVHTRYEEIIMGKTTSGLEIANDRSTTVSFREMLDALPKDPSKNMFIPFGVDISGNKICADLSEFPHMLIAGGTGSGKSVFAHGILASLIMRNRPEDLKLVLIDPKRVEMVKYHDIPHLLCPVIKEPSQAKVCLDKLIDEMEKRLVLFEFAGVRNIRSYNEKYCPKAGVEKMPFIVVFIDEYADLSNTCKNIGESVVRIAQKARAAGIHLIVATQRPSVDVITGVIKANLGVRVALKVKSTQDSQTVLGRAGAEELNGYGDMLVDCAQISKGGGFVRCQGCFVQDEELDAVTDFIRSQQKVVYDPNFTDLSDHSNDEKIAEENEKIERAAQREKEKGDLYETIKADVMSQEYTSISKIQRTYSVGFPRAGKIFNRLKAEGIVGEPDSQSSAKGARVLIHDPSMLSNGNEDFGGDNDK